MGIKHLVKVCLLKPIYKSVYRVSPQFADCVRNMVYGVVGRGRVDAERVSEYKTLQRSTPAIIVDLTETTRVDVGTGIQRVVNHVFGEMYDMAQTAQRDILPSREMGGMLVTNDKYLCRRKGMDQRAEEQRMHFVRGDKYFLLDSSWLFFDDFREIFQEAVDCHIGIYHLVYDLFPIQYPETSDINFVDKFTRWQNFMLEHGTGIICISRTTADTVARYFDEQREAGVIHRAKPLAVYHFPMGFDITEHDGGAREAMRRFVEGAGVTLLMVGTVEVRKQHDVVLQALEQMPDLVQGGRVRLLILGHDGWKNERFKKRLQADANGLFADHVLWVQDASDEEVQWAYRHCSALVAASQDEGFGLPLVEAAHFGLPIICSDIPIFHEVTEEHATFFREGDAADLARVIRMWIDEDVHPDSSLIPMHTWRESAEAILAILHGKVEPYRVVE